MTRRILFRPEAEAELVESLDWYEARSKGLGAELLRALDGVLANIERNPFAYPVVVGAARRAPMRRFPFNVVYRVTDDEILIVACFHASRDPKKLRKRI
jgi:plasmid stabilization system protein ParE